MDDDKKIEQLENELVGVKIRLKRLEMFLRDFPDIDEYLSEEDDTRDILNDPIYKEAKQVIADYDRASASLLQRRLSIGYAFAARILDQLEKDGFVSAPEGSKPREVIFDKLDADRKSDQK